MTAGWQRLEDELDTWAAAGRDIRIWWRDDDATAPSAALARLLDVAAARRAPLSLAVIPAQAEAALATMLRDHPAATAVLQHGFAHENHAGPSDKKCELVSPAERPAVIEELRRGREALRGLFAARFQSVLVPPWNRLSEALVARLPELGFSALSTYRPRRAAMAAPGLVQVNCHLDLLRWRPTRGFLGTEAALDLLVDHLADKRLGRADPAEPSGLLSHHRVHDAATWEFLDRLLARLNAHPAVRLLPAEAVFAPAPSEAAG